jgi:hypothetical protein
MTDDVYFLVITPSPFRSTGISYLEENLEVIYGAQQLRGKILSRKDLDHRSCVKDQQCTVQDFRAMRSESI